MNAGLDPAVVRKAAALVEKLDKVLDEFGARLSPDVPPIRFELIGKAGEFEAVPLHGDHVNDPTALAIGFVQ